MKWLFTSIVLFFSISLIGQSNIQLKINQKMGEEKFELNHLTQNDIAYPFDFTRLEYYLSQFSIIHDGGTETPIQDLYVLANANEELVIDLGEMDVTNIEEVRFYIGIDEATNHLDPASYDMSHPLAPKNPSMHWGWASGYRFVALEGNGGENKDFVFQIHALGNVNYSQVIIPVSKTAVDDQTIVELDADYLGALASVKVEQGLFTHGDKYEAKTLIFNMANSVFTASSITSFNEDIDVFNQVKVYPNPTATGSITLENTSNQPMIVNIYNGVGHKILNTTLRANENKPIWIDSEGMYFVKFVHGDKIVSKPVLVTK